MFNEKDEVKKALQNLKDSLKIQKETIPPADLISVLEFVKENRKKFHDEIPFDVMSKSLEMDFETLNKCLLTLILEKEIIGFINDKQTSDKSDDILILRDQHLIDKINEYSVE